MANVSATIEIEIRTTFCEILRLLGESDLRDASVTMRVTTTPGGAAASPLRLGSPDNEYNILDDDVVFVIRRRGPLLPR